MKLTNSSVYVVQHADMGPVTSIHSTRDGADEAQRERGEGYDVVMWGVHE